MRPLILDIETDSMLAGVRAFGARNPISTEAIEKAIANGTAVGDEPGRKLELMVGYRVAYSVEQQPGGWMRHMSVSIDGKFGMMANEVAVAEVAKRLGFKEQIPCPKIVSYIEEKESAHPAINVLEFCFDPTIPDALAAELAECKTEEKPNAV